MRRVKTIASGGSLFLCVLVVLLWGRSFFARDVVGVGWAHAATRTVSVFLITGDRGVLTLQPVDDTYFTPADYRPHEAAVSPARSMWKSDLPRPQSFGVHLWNKAGFADWRFHYRHSWGTHTERLLSFPDWSLLLLFAALPCARLIARTLAARRYGPGRCQSCGYDLRATPQRCPECGLAVEGA